LSDRIPYLLLALGWLLVLWGLAELFGWWVYPAGIGAAFLVCAVALAGWRNLWFLLAEGGIWKARGEKEGGVLE